MQDQRLLHQENDGQAQIDPRQLFPQLNEEGDQHLPHYQGPDEQQEKDQRPLHQDNDKQAQIDPMQLNPQLIQEENQQHQIHQKPDEQQSQDHRLLHQENDGPTKADPINIQQPSHEEEQQNLNQENENQIADDLEQDPNIEFNVKQNQDIPQRVTRSKNNIVKQSTKYSKDYVTVLKNS